MKKLSLCLFCILCVYSGINAQKKVGSYYNSYFEKKCDILASEIKNDAFDVYIEVNAEHDAQAMIRISGKDVDDFKVGLTDIKEKFIEWSDVAKKNNITELNKEMEIKIPNVTICWMGAEWHFSFSQKLTPKFIILDDRKYAATMVKKVTSSSNRYIDQTIYFVFSNPKDIDALLSELNVDKIREKLLSDEKAKNLFE